MTTLEFSWVAGDFVDTGDTTLRSEMLLIPLALLSSRLSFYEIRKVLAKKMTRSFMVPFLWTGGADLVA